MIIPFDGYKISLMVIQGDDGTADWQATVLQNFIPCVMVRSHDAMSAVSEATILFSEIYLTGRDAVRRHYYIGKTKGGKKFQGPSAN